MVTRCPSKSSTLNEVPPREAFSSSGAMLSSTGRWRVTMRSTDAVDFAIACGAAFPGDSSSGSPWAAAAVARKPPSATARVALRRA